MNTKKVLGAGLILWPFVVLFINMMVTMDGKEFVTIILASISILITIVIIIGSMFWGVTLLLD